MSLNIENAPQETALQPASAPLAFEQQPRESNRAFAAFRVYRDMGGARSLAATGVKLGKGKRQMEKWSKKFDWGVRVKAYASYLGEVERQTIQSVAREKAVEWDKIHEAVRREAWQKGTDLLALADDFLERWRETARVPGFESVVRGIELGIRLKQIAAGMPTEIKELNKNVSATLDVHWEVALRKIYGQANSGKVIDVEAVGGQGTEDRGQRTEIGGQGSEDGKASV